MDKADNSWYGQLQLVKELESWCMNWMCLKDMWEFIGGSRLYFRERLLEVGMAIPLQRVRTDEELDLPKSRRKLLTVRSRK